MQSTRTTSYFGENSGIGSDELTAYYCHLKKTNMKKTLFLFAATALFTACGESAEAPVDQPETPDTTATVETETEV